MSSSGEGPLVAASWLELISPAMNQLLPREAGCCWGGGAGGEGEIYHRRMYSPLPSSPRTAEGESEWWRECGHKEEEEDYNVRMMGQEGEGNVAIALYQREPMHTVVVARLLPAAAVSTAKRPRKRRRQCDSIR